LAILIRGKFPSTVSEIVFYNTIQVRLLNCAIVVGYDSAVYRSTKDGNVTIHPEKIYKGPEGTSPLWTHMTADYWVKLIWTYSGQRIDMEDTAKICGEKAYRAFW